MCAYLRELVDVMQAANGAFERAMVLTYGYGANGIGVLWDISPR
jgi:hypothetical protein